MWGNIINAVYQNKFNLVITSLVLLVIVLLVLPRIESVGGVMFTTSEDALRQMRNDIDDGYLQVYMDAKREAVRTNVAVEALAYRTFLSYYGDSLENEAAIYRLITHTVLRDVIQEFTISTVFRNHFPPLDESKAVEEHITRISIVGVRLSRSHISEMWRTYLPNVDGRGYPAYLKASGFKEEVITIKKESLLRTEVRKNEVINNIIAVYPELSVSGIKSTWSSK